MSDLSDEELVAALREGDMAAFDRLYARYERRLYGYICRIAARRRRPTTCSRTSF